MATEISSKEARSLCTAAEHELVRFSRQRDLKHVKAKDVRANIARTRRLRDKYRDLARRQRLVIRGKRQGKANGKISAAAKGAANNQRTVRKATLFDQTLLRFEAMLTRLEKPARSKKPRTSQRAKTKARGSGAVKASSVKRATPASQAMKRRRRSASASATTAAISASLLGVGSSLIEPKVTRSLRSAVVAPDQGLAARQTRRAAASKAATSGRAASHWSGTARKTIRGHVSALGRKNQARRDTRGAE